MTSGGVALVEKLFVMDCTRMLCPKETPFLEIPLKCRIPGKDLQIRDGKFDTSGNKK